MRKNVIDRSSEFVRFLDDGITSEKALMSGNPDDGYYLNKQAWVQLRNPLNLIDGDIQKVISIAKKEFSGLLYEFELFQFQPNPDVYYIACGTNMNNDDEFMLYEFFLIIKCQTSWICLLFNGSNDDLVWITDVKKNSASEHLNHLCKKQRHSLTRHYIGSPKSNQDDEVGIYLYDIGEQFDPKVKE